jgi:hypothetical protein
LVYDKIINRYFNDKKKLLKIILSNSLIDEDYYFVLDDARLGIYELLDISMFTMLNYGVGDFLFNKTLE